MSQYSSLENFNKKCRENRNNKEFMDDVEAAFKRAKKLSNQFVLDTSEADNKTVAMAGVLILASALEALTNDDSMCDDVKDDIINSAFKAVRMYVITLSMKRSAKDGRGEP